MSLTSRLTHGGLCLPLSSIRLTGLAGVLSNGHIAVLIGTSKRLQQRNLHQCYWSQPLHVGNTSGSCDMIQKPHSFASSNRIFRLYSSQATEYDSLGQLVYTGRVKKMFKTLKVFSLSTSAIGLAVQPYLWITFQNMPLGAALPLFTVINSFVFLNPILIHFIAKKYVTDLYFNQDTNVFTAYVMTFFARRETITFVAADVEVPDVPNMFAMFTVKGRPLFVQEDDFTNIAVYKHLMGFDRPLDLTFLREDIKDPTYLQDDKNKKN